MGSQNLNVTTEEKDIGVWSQDNLKVSKQVAEAFKANQVLGMIKHNFNFKNRNTIIRLYKSLVRPHLDYCSTCRHGVQVYRKNQHT